MCGGIKIEADSRKAQMRPCGVIVPNRVDYIVYFCQSSKSQVGVLDRRC